MSFLIYDLVFLAIFLILFSVFLYTRKHNLKKEGLLFLYKTQWGIKVINFLGTKYKRTVKVLSYISIFIGYLLTVGVLYLIYGVVKIYIFNPAIVRAVKVPPIIPLVPYLPQVFKLEFLPPFYFTYWIVILAVIAITHEMAHGIFMRRYNVKIKSTGFAFFPWFFPIFPAAFVEQDEKSMNKSKKFEQLAILSAGTFANVITAILFLFVLIGFFSLTFSASGVVFNSYATSGISVAGISMVNGVLLGNNFSYDKILSLSQEEGFNNLTYGNSTFLATKKVLENQKENDGSIVVFSDAPAIRENLSSIITKINGVQINSIEKLQEELSKYKPGDKITVTGIIDQEPTEKEIVLEEHPDRPGSAWLGIGFFSRQSGGAFTKLIGGIASFKSPNIYYEPKFDGMSIFIYNLLWWVVIISISVALINMLPVGIFDGGRFFYLTVLGITKREKIARRAFAFTTYFFLFILLLLMVFWAISFM